MFIAASCPSKREAAVTILIGVDCFPLFLVDELDILGYTISNLKAKEDMHYEENARETETGPWTVQPSPKKGVETGPEYHTLDMQLGG